jgi:transposase
MAKARTLVGLDVHAAKVVAAILDAETGELRFQRLGGESEPVARLCGSLEGPVRASYEAGPTGYGLARALEGAGVECVVAAPGKIPRGRAERQARGKAGGKENTGIPGRRRRAPLVRAGVPIQPERARDQARAQAGVRRSRFTST